MGCPPPVRCGSGRWRQPLLALARREKSDRMICYDPNIRSSLGLEREKYLRTVSEFRAEADLVKVSEDDVTWLVPDEAPEATCRRWADEGAVVALTKAAAGAAVFGPNGRYAEVPAAPVRLVDTVGAGDSFGAGLLAWLLAAGVATPTGLRALPRQGWEEALRLAVAAGAVTCGRPGADPPRRSELPASLWPD